MSIGLGVCWLLLSGCVVNAPPVAENTSDGLVRVQSKQVDTVYAKPGVSLARYKRVMLDSVELAFKLDWEKRHPEVSESDVARIRSQGSAVFYEIFSSALTLNNGYPLATQPGADVLRVTASITELDVAATPGSAGTQRMYVVSPSDLTLLMELRDSTDRRAAGARHRSGEGPRCRQSPGRRCRVEFRRGAPGAEMWAGLLRGALDAARDAPPAP